MTVQSKAMYIVLLFITINFSVAITTNLIKNADGSNFFDTSYWAGYDYDVDGNFIRNATANLETDVQSTGETEDKSDLIDRVLDVMALGFITKIANFIDSGLFGVFDMVETMFRPMLDENVGNILFRTLKFLLFMLYVVALVGFFANKSIVEEIT